MENSMPCCCHRDERRKKYLQQHSINQLKLLYLKKSKKVLRKWLFSCCWHRQRDQKKSLNFIHSQKKSRVSLHCEINLDYTRWKIVISTHTQEEAFQLTFCNISMEIFVVHPWRGFFFQLHCCTPYPACSASRAVNNGSRRGNSLWEPTDRKIINNALKWITNVSICCSTRAEGGSWLLKYKFRIDNIVYAYEGIMYSNFRMCNINFRRYPRRRGHTKL